MSPIIVFGANGLLGSSLVRRLRCAGYAVLTQSRAKDADLIIDPSSPIEVADALVKYRPQALVNLIAATNVDKCESDPAIAWQGNVQTMIGLTHGILSLGLPANSRPHLIHVSTDQVYSGNGPHSEEHINPINVYGMSKYAGELLAKSVGATILRTNFFGRSQCTDRSSFSDWIVNSLKEQASITAFNDVRFSAIHIETLCEIISLSIKVRPAGTFNAGCRDGISKAEFCLELANRLGLSTQFLTIGKSTSIPLKARRPVDMTLQVSKLEDALSIQCPYMQDEIEKTAKEYINDK